MTTKYVVACGSPHSSPIVSGFFVFPFAPRVGTDGLGGSSEAHFSTKQSSSSQEAWLPRTYGHSRRSCRLEGSARQGSRSALGLVHLPVPLPVTPLGRLHGRNAFARLAKEGRRYRKGPLSMTFRAGEGGPRVAFAVQKTVGPAVTRNLVRRRLRSHLAGQAYLMPSGEYLFRPAPAAAGCSFATLARHLDELIAAIPATPQLDRPPLVASDG